MLAENEGPGLVMVGTGHRIRSTDGGVTWENLQPVHVTPAPNLDKQPADFAPISQVLRLDENTLGGVYSGDFYTSGDNGVTWTRKSSIWDCTTCPVPVGAYDNTIIRASTGRTTSDRLILPVRFTAGAAHAGLRDAWGSWGTFLARLEQLETHAHTPEPDIAFVYSADVGNPLGETSWLSSDGGITIWHKEGHGGIWPCDEPSVVEARNGDIILFCRTTLGRIYRARGKLVDVAGDRRYRFDYPEPTSLASSYSPFAIRRIPWTESSPGVLRSASGTAGDLVLIWNQVSGEEIRAGYRRGRLSSAISSDDGQTWKHFRTIDALVLPPAGRIDPDAEPQMVRGLDYVGVVPDDYGSVHQPTFSVIDGEGEANDAVYVLWDRDMQKARRGDVVGSRMARIPISWFYEDRVLLFRLSKLVLRIPKIVEVERSGRRRADCSRWTKHRVPALFSNGRFYSNSRDLALYLKSPVARLERDLYGPAHQVITALGWAPTYGCTVKGSPVPRLTVWVTHPFAPCNSG